MYICHVYSVVMLSLLIAIHSNVPYPDAQDMYRHVPLSGGLNSSYYDNKMAILQSQLLRYTINHTRTQDRECAYFIALRACGLCVYNYSHVVCCVQQLFLVASSYKLFNL